MELTDNSLSARTSKTGRATYNLVAGKIVELEVAGEKEIEETVPPGKVWTVYINVDILETNA